MYGAIDANPTILLALGSVVSQIDGSVVTVGAAAVILRSNAAEFVGREIGTTRSRTGVGEVLLQPKQVIISEMAA